MSRASDYVAAISAYQTALSAVTKPTAPQQFKIPNLTAGVTPDGRCQIELQGAVIGPNNALRFGEWLIATFGETNG